MTALAVHPDDSEELLELELTDVCSLWTQSTIAQNQAAISRLWLAYRGGEILATDPEVGPGKRDNLSRFFPGLTDEGRRQLSSRWQRIYRFGRAAIEKYIEAAEEPTVSGILKEIGRKQKRQGNRELGPTELTREVRTGDFREVLQDLDDGSVDVILTDPPYSKEFLYLWAGLSDLGARLLKPGALLAAMSGQSYLPDVITKLSRSLSYEWMVAYLTPGGQAVQVWPRQVNTFWKPVLLYRNGERNDDHWIGDVAKSAVNDNDKNFHEWGQSESGMADLVERLTSPGDLVVDPFCGAGTTGVAALAAGRHFIGAEIDLGKAAVARKRLGLDA